MDILYIALVFFIVAIAIKIVFPLLGFGEAAGDMAFKVAIIFVALFVLVWLVQILLGSGTVSGGHSITF